MCVCVLPAACPLREGPTKWQLWSIFYSLVWTHPLCPQVTPLMQGLCVRVCLCQTLFDSQTPFVSLRLDWNSSTTLSDNSNIHGPLRINPDEFGHPWTFFLGSSRFPICSVWWNYWMHFSTKFYTFIYSFMVPRGRIRMTLLTLLIIWMDIFHNSRKKFFDKLTLAFNHFLAWCFRTNSSFS